MTFEGVTRQRRQDQILRPHRVWVVIHLEGALHHLPRTELGLHDPALPTTMATTPPQAMGPEL